VRASATTETRREADEVTSDRRELVANRSILRRTEWPEDALEERAIGTDRDGLHRTTVPELVTRVQSRPRNVDDEPLRWHPERMSGAVRKIEKRTKASPEKRVTAPRAAKKASRRATSARAELMVLVRAAAVDAVGKAIASGEGKLVDAVRAVVQDELAGPAPRRRATASQMAARKYLVAEMLKHNPPPSAEAVAAIKREWED
jgi:hypothetical protein